MGRDDKTTGAAISQTTPLIKMVLAIADLTAIDSLHMVLVATDPMVIGSLHTITPEIARTTTGRAALQRMAIGVHHSSLLTRIGIRAERRAIAPTEIGHPTSATIINVAHLILVESIGLTTIVGPGKWEETAIVPPTRSTLRAIMSGTTTPERLITTTIAPMRGRNETHVTIATSLTHQTRSAM
jgi:hypothetical protein